VAEIGPLLSDLARKELPEARSVGLPDELAAEIQWAHHDLTWPNAVAPCKAGRRDTCNSAR